MTDYPPGIASPALKAARRRLRGKPGEELRRIYNDPNSSAAMKLAALDEVYRAFTR